MGLRLELWSEPMIEVEKKCPARYFRRTMNIVQRTGFIVLFLLTNRVAAQVTCEAIVEKNVVEVGQAFTLTIEVSGKQLDLREKPVLPTLTGLELVYSEPGVSSSIQIINGRRSESRSYQYLLRARQVGRWTVAPVRVSVGGETYQTQQLTIEVVPAGAISGQNPTDVSGDVFFAAVPSKRTAYVGEQIIVDFKIFTRVSVSQYSPTRTPNLIGFWVEEFPLKQPLEGVREVIDGKPYTSYTIKRVAVFATRSGTLEIDPAEIECELRLNRRKTNDPFDNFFSPFGDPFGEIVTQKFSTRPISITVRELPLDGKPDHFSGLVGEFDVRTSLDRRNLRTGEALTYRIDVSGAGNLRSLEEPENPFPEEFERYPVKVSDAIQKNGSRVAGSKTFEFVVIPRVSKAWTIEPYTLTYFDPRRNEYVTKSADTLVVEVSEGPAGQQPRSDVALLKKDLRFIRTDPQSWVRVNAPWWQDTWAAVFFVVPPAFVGWRLLRKRNVDQLRADGVRYRSMQASPLARRRLKDIQKLLKLDDPGRFYAELSRLLNQFIADKLNLSGLQLISRDIADRLRQRGVPDHLLDEYLRCMQLCDEARFAPSPTGLQETDKVYQLVRSTLVEIDRRL